MYLAKTTRPKRCVGEKSESVTKGRANIGIRCPPRRADWEFGETVCSNKPFDQPSCWGGCTTMLVQGSASISDMLLSQSRIAQQIGDSMSPLSRRIYLDCSATLSSVAKHAHRRIVHKSACRGPTPCGVDLPTINHANRRNRRRADATHSDALWDERTGDENRLFTHFFLSLSVALDRRIRKRGAGRD